MENNMKTIEILVGTDIESACRQLVQAAQNAPGRYAQCEFNGVTITATANSEPTDLVDQWRADMAQKAEEYRKSPAGIKAAQEAEERLKAAQATYDRCIGRLPGLDFGNDAALLDWMAEIQDAADHIGVKAHTTLILKFFRDYGFVPGMNCGKDFDGDDSHNFAASIGQCLDGFRAVGAPHQVVHRFIEDWKAKFVS